MSQYHPTIPQASDDPSDSQQDILDNFGQLNTQIQVNHVPLVGSQTPGFHTQLFFPKGLAFTADPNLAVPQASMYPKTATNGNTELFFQNTNLPSGVSQLTNLPVVNGIITNVVPGAPTTQITSANHGLASTNTITINGVYGSTELNGNPFVVTVTGVDTFTIPTAVMPSAYVSGGYWTQTGNTRYGVYTPWGLKFNFGLSSTPAGQFYAIPYNSVNYITQVTAFLSTNAGLNSTPTLTQFTYIVAGGNQAYYFSFGV